MKTFDPFGRLEKYFSAGTLHLAIRAGVVLVLAALILYRIKAWNHYFFKPLWAVETIIFIIFLISYATRSEPLQRSRGAREILIPLAGSGLPFALLFSPPHHFVTSQILYVYIIFIWMTAASTLTAWGLWTLRRSFSITVEARKLVTRGPYRFVRHPVYLGEILTAAAVGVWRFSAINLALLALFGTIQLYRSKMEEAKLAKTFPAYADFAAGSRWFWSFRRER